MDILLRTSNILAKTQDSQFFVEIFFVIKLPHDHQNIFKHVAKIAGPTHRAREMWLTFNNKKIELVNLLAN